MDEELLDRAAGELERAVDALVACRAEHRRVEVVLMAVLEHVPACVAVVDGASGVVRAASLAAEKQWGVAVDAALPDGVRSGAVAVDIDDGSTLLWSTPPSLPP